MTNPTPMTREPEGVKRNEFRSQRYRPYSTLDTRGSGQIALSTCTRCGALVEVSDQEAVRVHDAWHKGNLTDD